MVSCLALHNPPFSALPIDGTEMMMMPVSYRLFLTCLQNFWRRAGPFEYSKQELFRKHTHMLPGAVRHQNSAVFWYVTIQKGKYISMPASTGRLSVQESVACPGFRGFGGHSSLKHSSVFTESILYYYSLISRTRNPTRFVAYYGYNQSSNKKAHDSE